MTHTAQVFERSRCHIEFEFLKVTKANHWNNKHQYEKRQILFARFGVFPGFRLVFPVFMHMASFVLSVSLACRLCLRFPRLSHLFCRNVSGQPCRCEFSLSRVFCRSCQCHGAHSALRAIHWCQHDGEQMSDFLCRTRLPHQWHWGLIKDEGISSNVLFSMFHFQARLTFSSIHCFNSGFIVFVLLAQFATECYCGRSLPTSARKLDDSACQIKCGGNPDEFCGGKLALSVFESPGDKEFFLFTGKKRNLIRVTYLVQLIIISTRLRLIFFFCSFWKSQAPGWRSTTPLSRHDSQGLYILFLWCSVDFILPCRMIIFPRVYLWP